MGLNIRFLTYIFVHPTNSVRFVTTVTVILQIEELKESLHDFPKIHGK